MAEELYNEEIENESLILPGGDYSGKSEFSKPVIVQTQILRCLQLRSLDMRQGYTSWKQDIRGQAHPEIIADTRKAFIGSVDVLFNLLAPEIADFNPELEEQYEKEKKRLFEKYCYEETNGKKFVESPNGLIAKWIYTGRKYMPHLGDGIEQTNPAHKEGTGTIAINGLWDKTLNAYWDEMLKVSDELFKELNLVIAQAKYFGKKKGM